MSSAGVARETLAIVERGSYVAPSGATVVVREQVEAAVAGTVLHRPDDFAWLGLSAGVPGGGPPRIEVTSETTAEAARRLVVDERLAHVVALNFASAKNPGGGFLGGAKAQEEDLARCSALYTCQLTQRAYYDANRATASMLYTDHILHSPDVPFFRDEALRLLESPFVVSIITAPAPNAGEASRNGRSEGRRVREVLEARARKVVQVAAAHGHRTLVLGAWGCGVFRNEPAHVADAFGKALCDPVFAGAFDRAVFAIRERGTARPIARAFEERLLGRALQGPIRRGNLPEGGQGPRHQQEQTRSRREDGER